jgi:hypothetical protein
VERKIAKHVDFSEHKETEQKEKEVNDKETTYITNDSDIPAILKEPENFNNIEYNEIVI